MFLKRYKLKNTKTSQEFIVFESVLQMYIQNKDIEIIEELKEIDVKDHAVSSSNTQKSETSDIKVQQDISNLTKTNTKEVTSTVKATSKKTVAKKSTTKKSK